MSKPKLSQGQKIDRILWYLESDPATKRIGMSEQQQINTERLNKIENRHKIIYRVGVVIGAIGGGVITWLIKLKSVL